MRVGLSPRSFRRAATVSVSSFVTSSSLKPSRASYHSRTDSCPTSLSEPATSRKETTGSWPSAVAFIREKSPWKRAGMNTLALMRRYASSSSFSTWYTSQKLPVPPKSSHIASAISSRTPPSVAAELTRERHAKQCISFCTLAASRCMTGVFLMAGRLLMEV